MSRQQHEEGIPPGQHAFQIPEGIGMDSMVCGGIAYDGGVRDTTIRPFHSFIQHACMACQLSGHGRKVLRDRVTM